MKIIILFHLSLCIHLYPLIRTYSFLINRAIGLMSRVFTNGPGDWGSIPGWVIPKTQKKKKTIFDAALHNTQHYEVRNKGKVEQSSVWSFALPYTSV